MAAVNAVVHVLFVAAEEHKHCCIVTATMR
jgi:hypothetical protein